MPPISYRNPRGDARLRSSSIVLLLSTAAGLIDGTTCLAQTTPARTELLSNGDFESPVVGGGNNFLATLPSWTIDADRVPTDPTAGSFNLVRPFTGYGTGPNSTPPGGGAQYLDINDSGGTLRQTFDVPQNGTIEFGAWFSQRDRPQTIDRSFVRLTGPDGSTVAEAHVVFDGSDPIDTWKRTPATTIDVVRGRYVFEIVMGDPVNTDSATVLYRPTSTAPLIVRKSVRTVADPINRRNNPKAIPGAFVTYSIEVVNDGDVEIDADSQILEDATPRNTDVYLGDAFPIVFDAGQSGMTLRYSRSDSSDDVEFSSDGGSSWAYGPRAGISDPSITNVRFRPKGVMKARSAYRISMTYVLH